VGELSPRVQTTQEVVGLVSIVSTLKNQVWVFPVTSDKPTNETRVEKKQKEFLCPLS
jgi:hypothetical protein